MALGSRTSDVVTRPATADDRVAVIDLIEAMGGHDGVSAAPGLAAVFGAVVENPEMRSVVAVAGHRVVGYAEIHARPSVLHGVREAWLAAMVVSYDDRGSGVGATLLSAIDHEAARLGCERVVLEASTWRNGAHSFYAQHGFAEAASPAVRLARPVREPPPADLPTRFLDAAALAASAAVGAVSGLRTHPDAGIGADGAHTLAADLAAERAIVAQLEGLALCVISEESGIMVQAFSPDEPWVCLDPLDGSRNFAQGHPPWATAIGLVLAGQPIAGLVVDHTSGRRWWAATGRGAWVDGRPARPRPGGLVAVPSVGSTEASRFRLPRHFDRARMSGSTAIDLCRVADGSLGGFLDVDRAVVHPHDLAAPMAILNEAGAALARADGEPIAIEPDPMATTHLVAAPDQTTLDALLEGC